MGLGWNGNGMNRNGCAVSYSGALPVLVVKEVHSSKLLGA